MAKGNMLQGMSRGKVGDVVFSRLDGEQIARVRNRHPKNPKSAKQLYQRAIMATVMQAYSAGIEIFDHSFEGCAKGAECQRRFISLNTKILRQQMANDIENSLEIDEQIGRVIAPGVSSPTICKLRVSEGSLPATSLITISSGQSNYFIIGSANSGETVASYLTRYGVTAGDVITIVGFMCDNTSDPLFVTDGAESVYGKQYDTSFVFIRLIVKNDALSSEDVAAGKNLAGIFDVYVSNLISETRVNALTVGGFSSLSELLTSGNLNCSAMGIIRSRVNEDLRSNCDLVYDPNMEWGIATSYALAAWQQGATTLGDSDLILEGGDD